MLVDLRHLWRNLRRSPASAGAAILTLSLTLGVGGSIFAVVHAVLLTPPPFGDPDALVIVGEAPIDEPTVAPRASSYATFVAWRERAGSLAALEAFDPTNATLTELGPAERVSVNDVTPGFLTLLGVTPTLGRPFTLEDVGRPVAILSHAFWRTKLAADSGAIGRQIVLGGQSHTIVGVLPEAFIFELNPADLWRPVPVTPAQAGAGIGYASLPGSRRMSLQPHCGLRSTTSVAPVRRRRVSWWSLSPRRYRATRREHSPCSRVLLRSPC